MGLGRVAGQEVVLAKPQTMMNLSGVAVRMLLERYECEPADMIVLIDEVDLPWGMLRIRERGSDGTHNGLKSIIASIGHGRIYPRAAGREAGEAVGRSQDYVLCTMGRDGARDRRSRWRWMRPKQWK